MPSRVLVALRVKASPQRAFEAFTSEIAFWWRRNGLFEFARGRTGVLAFEPGLGGRFIESFSDGQVLEIGRISVWEPPTRLAFSWRPETFAPEQSTEVQVHFEPIGDEPRVTVEHIGWDTIPREHVTRHGFPDDAFYMRLAEWWQALLASYQSSVVSSC